jgi:ATP-dependent protease ClpP protease subunit
MKKFLVSLCILFSLTGLASADKMIPDKQVFSRPSVELTGMNTVVMDGEINIVSTDVTIKALTAVAMVAKGQPVYLLLVSPGGELNAAMALKDSMDTIPNLYVICKFCASAAGMLFVTAKHRLALENSEFMAHEPYLTRVNAEMLMNTDEMTQFLVDSLQFDTLEATAMGMTIDMYLLKIRSSPEEMWWLHGKELVANKAADKVVTLNCNAYMNALAPKSCSGK